MARQRTAGRGDRDGHSGTGSLRWLLTYADMITLLMVFFIVLYAMSQISKTRYLALAMSLRNSFLAQENGDSAIRTATTPTRIPHMLPNQSQIVTMKDLIEETLAKAGVKKLPPMTVTTRGLVMSFSEQAAFFQAARARLQPRFRRILRLIAPILAKSPNAVEVDGYTDNLPLYSLKYKDSWQLSSRRATNVVDYLTKRLGLDPYRFSAQAYGAYRPRYPNDNMTNRKKNRRVDVVVLRHPPAAPWGGPLPAYARPERPAARTAGPGIRTTT